MGRCETASALVAVVLTPARLCAQLGAKRAMEIMRSLDCPMFMDENGYTNEIFERLSDKFKEEDFTGLCEALRTHGVVCYDRSERRTIRPWRAGEDEERIWNCPMAVKSETLVDSERWGHNRNGVNANSVSMLGMKEVQDSMDASARAMGLVDYEVQLVASIDTY
eukprot:TRINITY_DN8863_c0_g1_i1.p1 TRINITY_DN8863_c0_g1~~TRINITY_DN8863_c0_g1_i1.p1  ORF type:complete len:186 (+),score=21.70 TRINITY_DN8863_c0_g1_i1:66-560(+)